MGGIAGNLVRPAALATAGSWWPHRHSCSRPRSPTWPSTRAGNLWGFGCDGSRLRSDVRLLLHGLLHHSRRDRTVAPRHGNGHSTSRRCASWAFIRPGDHRHPLRREYCRQAHGPRRVSRIFTRRRRWSRIAQSGCTRRCIWSQPWAAGLAAVVSVASFTVRSDMDKLHQSMLELPGRRGLFGEGAAA